MPATLRMGSSGYDVAVLQFQVNARDPVFPDLIVDGIFGKLTHQALVAFQKNHGLKPDGIAGPLTHTGLAYGLKYQAFNHQLRHFPQPTSTTCWAASTAAMTRSNIPAVIAKTPKDMIMADGALANYSSSDQAVVAGARYGAAHGLRCNAPQSWSVGALVTALRRSPLMFDMLWKSDEYVQAMATSGHMVVVSAFISDGKGYGDNTHLMVLDPWKPHIGKVYWVEYGDWMREVPTRTYRVFERG